MPAAAQSSIILRCFPTPTRGLWQGDAVDHHGIVLRQAGTRVICLAFPTPRARCSTDIYAAEKASCVCYLFTFPAPCLCLRRLRHLPRQADATKSEPTPDPLNRNHRTFIGPASHVPRTWWASSHWLPLLMSRSTHPCMPLPMSHPRVNVPTTVAL